MEKNKLLFVIFGTVFAVGIIILMDSINLGQSEASRVIQANGGSMDTGTYLVYFEHSITKYRFLGSILSVLGGLGILKNI